MRHAVIKSWVKLLYNLDRIEAADHNQIVVISYSDSDCDPSLVQTEEFHQVSIRLVTSGCVLVHVFPGAANRARELWNSTSVASGHDLHIRHQKLIKSVVGYVLT